MSIIESANGVGARLAEARSEAGLSVEDLSSRSYIRPAVIRGIENDDFSACGGPFYARGHIRTLARMLGLDESPLLEQFDRSNGSTTPRAATAPVESEETGRHAPRVRSRSRTSDDSASGGAAPLGAGRLGSGRLGSGRLGGGRLGSRPGGRTSWMAVATFVLIAICLIALGSLLLGGPAKKNSPTASAPPQPSAKPAPSAPAVVPPAPARQYSGVNLLVRIAQGSSWVQISDENGKVLASSVGTAGMQSEFRGAQRLKVTFGNAAAIAASCNGKSLGLLGGEGQVVSRVFVLGDPACGPSSG